MPTRKKLADLVPAIRLHIMNHLEYLTYNNRLFLVHEGQLRKEIEDSMRQELTGKSFTKAIRRVPSINLLQRIIDKLSRVYSERAKRTSAVASDEELVQYYEQTTCVDERMASANRIYNLQKCVALEPYLYNGKPALRVLPAHQFLVFSDDPENPTCPTVFIKFMGEADSFPFTDRDGTKVQTDEVHRVQLYYLYSDQEFMILDSDGATRTDLMSAMQAPRENPYGIIPFLYINRSDFRLIPVPDTDTLENTILIPKLLADLNYAVQFQSHSIFTAVDLDLPADMAMAPDTVWPLKSSEGATGQGRLDVVRPSIDIDGVLRLIATTLSVWLESRNIKPGDMGQKQIGDAASGVARIVDEADATQDRQIQAARFIDAERALWALIGKMHNFWVRQGLLTDKPKTFSEAVAVTTVFGDQRPIVSETETLNAITVQMSAGLMSKRQAIKKLYPTFSDADVEAWLEELDDGTGGLQGAAGQDPSQDKGPQDPGGDGQVPSGNAPGAGAGQGSGSAVPGGEYVAPSPAKP